MNTKHPPGPPMTLGNMRELGVQNLIAVHSIELGQQLARALDG